MSVSWTLPVLGRTFPATPALSGLTRGVRAALLARKLPKPLRRWGRTGVAAGLSVAALLSRPRPRQRRASTVAVRRVYGMALAGTYLSAFTSLKGQALGLWGERGILPIGELLERAREVYPEDHKRRLPSLLWWDSSDEALVKLCEAGQVASVAMMLGIAPRAMALFLWGAYLSFHSVGREFLSFQWDTLLLEAGLLAILFSPPGMVSTRGDPEPSFAARWMMRWLASRLHLESGLAKVLGGDETWRKMTACNYYYETAPLPTKTGWYAHHLPERIQKLSTATAVTVELVAPLLALGPRWARLAAFWSLTGLQTAFALTGNYGFFNILSAAQALWLLDDKALKRVVPKWLAREQPRGAPAWRNLTELAVALPLLGLTTRMLSRFRQYPAPPLPEALEPLRRFGRKVWDRVAPRLKLPKRARTWLDTLEEHGYPFRLVSPYGLFAAMTLERPEITVEGSDDGVTWRAYRFHHKVDDLNGLPGRVAPHMPRLDWMMWFAALRSPPGWFISFARRLLEGSPEVLGLLRDNPFPDKPPRYLRAQIHRYNMTTLEERRQTGNWWKRERLGLYLPPIALGGAVV